MQSMSLQDYFNKFLKLESSSGILLMFAAVIAIIVANSPWSEWYLSLLNIPVEIRIGTFQLAKPLLLWINDGLMAIFFFLVGLELKRELIEGELSDSKKIVLPAAAAIGGMLFPALIYYFFNQHDPVALKGWAIPAATDIAFALGILALLGQRVPTGLKIFLVSLAIIDDIGAIVIIALFYTADLSIDSLIVAGIALSLLTILNIRKVTNTIPYILLGIILWIAVLKSGIHATLAGVLLAFFIPIKITDDSGHAPAKRLEHDLHASVSFVIVPIFAFANAGVPLHGLTLDSFTSSVPVGIALGLFAGKQIGVMLMSYIAVKLGWAGLPEGTNWKYIYGAAILCGVGFTMSLFIGSLAFESGGLNQMDDRLGILVGSLASALFGYFYLNKVLPSKAE
jgi:NhaA family Na+:H+ antiporter